MKKFNFLALSILLVSASAFAQETAAPEGTPLKFWIKSSAVISSMTGDADFIDQKNGVNFAAEVELPIINPHFAIQTGLNYMQYGVTSVDSFSINNFTLDFDGTVSLNYIQIPVLFKVKEGAFALYVGPYFGIATSRNYKFTAAVNSGGTPTAVARAGDLNDYTKSFDAGARVGIAYEPVILNTFNLTFGLMHDSGFTQVNKDTPTLHNAAFLLTAGVGVRL